jgi:hypothetical protein
LKNSLCSAFLLLLTVLAACSDKDPLGPGELPQITGNYTLQSINGRPLPFVLVSFLDVYQLTHRAGSLVINADSTYVERADLRETINDETGVPRSTDTTVVIRGRWEREDSAIVLQPTAGGTPLIGLIGNARLTLNYEATNDSLYTYVFVRSSGSGASRPLAFHATSSGSVPVSTIFLRTTTSSTIGLRSMTTSSVKSSRASSVRASSGSPSR